MNFLKNQSNIFVFQLILAVFLPFTGFAQWSTPVNLSPNAMSAKLNENMGPCIAANGDTLHVVWSDHRTQGFAIYYLHSLDSGLTWSNPVPITDTMGKASDPVVAAYGKNVHVVWMDSVNGIRASFYKRSLNGGITWQPEICLDSNTKFWPGVAVSGNKVYVSLDKIVSTSPYNTEVFLITSINNGATWGNENQISYGPDRSEDQSLAVLGKDVHFVWNDKRSGSFETYYRHSSDGGVSWGPETVVSGTGFSYGTMVCANGPDVNVVFGKLSSNNIHMNFSNDTGNTWGTEEQISFNPKSVLYPFLARSGSNLHVVYTHLNTVPMESWYLYSGNGGLTWNQEILLGNGTQPFIAITGCIVHSIYFAGTWLAGGKIFYTRNPNGNGNCSNLNTTSFQENFSSIPFQNPNNGKFTVEVKRKSEIEIYNAAGEKVFSKTATGKQEFLDLNLMTGIYFLKTETEKGFEVKKMLIQNL